MNYMIQGDNVIIAFDGGENYTINPTHFNYEKIMKALSDERFEDVMSLVNPKEMILKYGQERISIKGDRVFWDGHELANSLTRRILNMYEKGFPLKPFALFMENLMHNPSNRAVNELYSFLERNNLPISQQGNFFAYKKIREDYTDMHSGTIDNSVGVVVSMERNLVDDDKTRTCSHGLHFCSREYLDRFKGDRLVVLEVNPKDVVSIPVDYNYSKGRCCEYTVVDEIMDEDVDEEELDNLLL